MQPIISPGFKNSRTSTNGGDCSDFGLFTYEKDGSQVALYGVLTELPTFSMTAEYTDGPGSSVASLMEKFMCNDLMSVANALGTKGDAFGFNNILASGNITKRVYNGVNEPSSFDLKFRLYNDYHVPGISSATEWINYLSKYATIDAKNNISAANLKENIIAAGKNVAEAGAEVVRLVNTKKEEDEQSNTEKKKKLVKKLLDWEHNINEKLKLVNECVVKIYGFNPRFNATHWQDRIGNDYHFGIQIAESPNKPNSNALDSLESDGGIDSDPTADSNAIYSLWKNPNDLIDPKQKELKYEDCFEDCFSEFFSSATDNAIVRYLNNSATDNWKTINTNKSIDSLMVGDAKTAEGQELRKILSDICNGDEDETALLLKRFNDSETRKFIDKIGEKAVARYNIGRVKEKFNMDNSLGAKLWSLNIFPWLFKMSIPVYVASWTYTKSAEYDAYYDFNIKCVCDQIFSRDRWKLYFNGAAK